MSFTRSPSGSPGIGNARKGNGKGETPNPKHQTPDKSQARNPNSARDVAALKLVIWSFSGVWSLEFWSFHPSVWSLVFGVLIHNPPRNRICETLSALPLLRAA